MTALAWLLPAALALGSIGLVAFFWALRTRQFEDLEGAGWRVLEDGGPIFDADDKAPVQTLPDPPHPAAAGSGRVSEPPTQPDVARGEQQLRSTRGAP